MTRLSATKRFRKNRKTLLALAIAAAISGSLVAAPEAMATGLVTQNITQALMATETVSGSTQQTVASIGPLTNNGGSEQQTGIQSGIDNGTLAVVPVNQNLSTTVYTSNQDAENAVSSYVQGYLSEITNALLGAMKGNNTSVQMGLFTFIQNVQIANPAGGKPTKAQVYATVQVNPNGSYQFLGTNINNDTLYLMYAIYEQSKDAAYLPAGWTVPGAGELQWELDQITVEGSTIQSAPVSINGSIWHTIQDNGAYDGAETQNNGKEQINYGPAVASLIKNQFTPLMGKYNASIGLLEYGEQVKAARTSSGAPITAIEVTQRTFTQSQGVCGGSGGAQNLSDSGNYGYLLTQYNNEYIVQPSGSYAMAGQNQSNTISPTQNFTNESVQIPAGASPANYEQDIVFPMAPDQGQLVNVTSGNPLPGSDYTYVAPLTVINGNSGGSSSDYQQITVNGNTYCGNFGQLTQYEGGFSGPTMYENNVQMPSSDFKISISMRHLSPGHDYYNQNNVNVVGVGINGQYLGWPGQTNGPAFDVSYCDNSMYCGGEVCTPEGCASIANGTDGY